MSQEPQPLKIQKPQPIERPPTPQEIKNLSQKKIKQTPEIISNQSNTNPTPPINPTPQTILIKIKQIKGVTLGKFYLISAKENEAPYCEDKTLCKIPMPNGLKIKVNGYYDKVITKTELLNHIKNSNELEVELSLIE